jgi:hypothetical protein
MLTLHPGAFIETESSCSGPRYTRGQPNREDPGVILSDLQDKYIPEFELPYRNILRYTKEIERNWERLDNNQRKEIQKALAKINIKKEKKEKFGNEGMSVMAAAKFVSKDPEKRVPKLMDLLWKPTKMDKREIAQGLSSSEEEKFFKKVRTSVYDWGTDQPQTTYGGLSIFFVILLFLLIGVAAGIAGK